MVFFAVLTVWSATNVEWSNLFNSSAGSSLGSIVLALVSPDMSINNLGTVVDAAWTTVAYAVTSLSLAIAFGIPLGAIASGTISHPGRVGVLVAVATRAILGLSRSIHELIWALLFVAALGLSPAAGILAIALPYAGIIGRIVAEKLQDVPQQQVQSIESTGATGLQQFFIARLPSILPETISYLFYRFECAIRTASVLSFVGLGGIGFQVHLALNDLKFDRVGTLLYSLLILILLVDLLSRSVRKRLTGTK